MKMGIIIKDYCSYVRINTITAITLSHILITEVNEKSCL